MAIPAQRAIPIALLLTACHDPAPDVSSDHVDLYLDPEIQICAGELARSDAFIERIYEVWTGGPPDIRIQLHAEAALAEPPCTGEGVGCTSGSSIWFEQQNTQDFLAVRAMLRHTDGRSAPMFDPGVPIALAPFNAFSYQQSQTQDFSPTLLSSNHPDAYDVGKLALVSRYLLDRFGSDAFRAYFRAMAPADERTPEGYAKAFEQHFGAPLDVAWADFQSAPRCAYELRFCDQGIESKLPIEVDGIDCDDPNTFGYSAPTLESDLGIPYRPQQILLLDNDAPRTVTLEQEAGTVIVVACGACSHEIWSGSAPATTDLELDVGRYAVIATGRKGDDAKLSMRER